MVTVRGSKEDSKKQRKIVWRGKGGMVGVDVVACVGFDAFSLMIFCNC